jgi:recombinase-like zinc beta ribbon protein
MLELMPSGEQRARSASRRAVSGSGVRRPLAEWDVLLKDQHEGYISWDEFERNQQVIANNATGKGSAVAKGAVRRGELLLAGLLRCGHCGRKMYVAYGGKAGRYLCKGALVNHGTERCISFGGLRVDDAVGTEVLRVLKPLSIEAAVKALDAQAGETSAAKRQLERALERARFEAAHARRQYDAVDPANRLVAGELERRWNEALQVVHRIESEIASRRGSFMVSPIPSRASAHALAVASSRT